jgi:hypothetical protein
MKKTFSILKPSFNIYGILILLIAVMLIMAGCKNPRSEQQIQAVLYGPGSTEAFPVKKDTIFKVGNLRSGSIKTDKGWNVQEFAHSFFNPNPDTITISLKMISDNPAFIFANGQVGIFTKTYTLKPIFGCTDNVFISPAFEHYKPNWPVSANSNFTGSVEFSSTKPFYYYMLHQTPIGEGVSIDEAYFAAWNPCEYDEAGVWDKDLDLFVIPYTNYWHNCKIWEVGWNSSLKIKNNTDTTVNYTIRHIPFYGAQYNPENGWITRFEEQVVIVPLQKNGELKVSLMDLYGWSTTQSASMEGCLYVTPDRKEATGKGTTMKLIIVPNESGKPLHEAIP